MRLEWPLIGSVFLVLVRRCVSVDTLRIHIPIDSKCNVFPCAHVSTLFSESSFHSFFRFCRCWQSRKLRQSFEVSIPMMGRCPECHGFFGVISSFSSTLEWSDLSFCRFCRIGRCPTMFQILCTRPHPRFARFWRRWIPYIGFVVWFPASDWCILIIHFIVKWFTLFPRLWRDSWHSAVPVMFPLS